MNLVVVDTSTRWAAVGLQTDSGDQTQTVWRSEQNHGRELMPAIVELLDRASVRPSEITHLGVALGPGGFSAVRVGVSTVLGLALPGNLPVVGVPTHSIEAFPFLESATTSSPLISLIPAGRGELAWARFQSALVEIDEPETGLSTIDELLTDLPPGSLLCGEGVELLPRNIDPEKILSGEPPTRSPVALLEIVNARIETGELTPITELRPIYARPPSITLPKRPR